MHDFEQLKEMLMEEVSNLTKKGELTAGSLDTVDKLLNSIKNACKIIMYDEYKDEGYSYESGYSRARNRDSRGRYSRQGNYSNARNGRGRNSRDNGYSYDDGESDMVEALYKAMDEAESEQEKMVIKKMIRRMEQA